MHRTTLNKLFSAWDLIWIKLDFIKSTFYSRFSLSFQGCAAGKGLKTSGNCCFKARRAGSIRIGNHVTLLAGHRSNRVGLTNRVLLETLDEGLISIGDHSGGSAVVISSRSSISIGEYVKMGGNVRIFDHDFHSLDSRIRRTKEDRNHVNSRPVSIGKEVFIGTNSTILKGVTIGERSIVAAGSVVVKSIPADEVWGGNPAKCIR